MNARMGGAVGGGLQGGMATTAMLGARERAEAQASASEKTRNLQMDWLDRQLSLKEKDIDRQYGREMSDKDKTHALEVEAIRMGIDLPPEWHEAKANEDWAEADRIYNETTGGGSSGEGSYSNGVFGGEGYGEADRTYRVDDKGSQHWRFGSGGYEVSGHVTSVLFGQMLASANLEADALGGMFEPESEAERVTRESTFLGGQRPRNYTFKPGPAASEIQAWFSQYLEDNDGDYPDQYELRDKLKSMEII
jgi:hypothetical protein